MHLVSATCKSVAVTGKVNPASGAPAGLGAWLLGRWRVWHNGQRPVRRHMRVVEQLALGGKRQLLLVDIGGERFLVGGGSESVDTIVRVRPETRSGATPITRGEHG